MFKKLFFLIFVVFAFTEIKAQNIISVDNSCVTNGTSDTYEFEPQAVLVNGRYDYLRISTPTLLGQLYNAVGNSGSVGIQFDGSQWIFYYNNNPSSIVFTAPDNGLMFPPALGWVSDGSPCSNPAAALELKGNVFLDPEHIVTTDLDCAILGTVEFISITDIGGSSAFRVLNSINPYDSNSGWGTSQGATLHTQPLVLLYSITNLRWEINSLLETYFVQETAGPGLPPDSGWIGAGGTCDNSDTLFLTAENSGVLPIDRLELDLEVTLYPNPSNDVVYISNLKSRTRVLVTNITGQVVKNKVLDNHKNSLDIQELKTGFYFVEIEGQKTIKLVKN